MVDEQGQVIGTVAHPCIHRHGVPVSPLNRVSHAVSQTSGDMRVFFVGDHVDAVDFIKNFPSRIPASVIDHAHIGVSPGAEYHLRDRGFFIACRYDD
jgi:hypothetical protein